MIPDFISRAERMMLRTGRADQADGVARAYSLLFSITDQGLHLSNDLILSSIEVFEQLEQQLRDTIDLAHNDLSEAVDGRPMHGTFAALRLVSRVSSWICSSYHLDTLSIKTGFMSHYVKHQPRCSAVTAKHTASSCPISNPYGLVFIMYCVQMLQKDFLMMNSRMNQR
jgi:hypothetical protein